LEEEARRIHCSPDLQVVELVLRDGDDLIDGVYDALWAA
jgi:hypothetical protein